MPVGRPHLSDDEKRRRGTFDPRYSAEARGTRRAEKVVALFKDRVEEIPPPPAGLSQPAMEEYMRWCRTLHHEQKLTVLWVEKITLYAMAKHNNLTRLAAGKMSRLEDTRIMKSILSELTGINADAPINPTETQSRKFARIGFAKRVRAPAER